VFEIVEMPECSKVLGLDLPNLPSVLFTKLTYVFDISFGKFIV
jgi:hypothetical protein